MWENIYEMHADLLLGFKVEIYLTTLLVSVEF